MTGKALSLLPFLGMAVPLSADETASLNFSLSVTTNRILVGSAGLWNTPWFVEGHFTLEMTHILQVFLGENDVRPFHSVLRSPDTECTGDNAWYANDAAHKSGENVTNESGQLFQIQHHKRKTTDDVQMNKIKRKFSRLHTWKLLFCRWMEALCQIYAINCFKWLLIRCSAVESRMPQRRAVQPAVWGLPSPARVCLPALTLQSCCWNGCWRRTCKKKRSALAVKGIDNHFVATYRFFLFDFTFDWMIQDSWQASSFNSSFFFFFCSSAKCVHRQNPQFWMLFCAVLKLFQSKVKATSPTWFEDKKRPWRCTAHSDLIFFQNHSFSEKNWRMRLWGSAFRSSESSHPESTFQCQSLASPPTKVQALHRKTILLGSSPSQIYAPLQQREKIGANTGHEFDHPFLMGPKGDKLRLLAQMNENTFPKKRERRSVWRLPKKLVRAEDIISIVILTGAKRDQAQVAPMNYKYI